MCNVVEAVIELPSPVPVTKGKLHVWLMDDRARRLAGSRLATLKRSLRLPILYTDLWIFITTVRTDHRAPAHAGPESKSCRRRPTRPDEPSSMRPPLLRADEAAGAAAAQGRRAMIMGARYGGAGATRRAPTVWCFHARAPLRAAVRGRAAVTLRLAPAAALGERAVPCGNQSVDHAVTATTSRRWRGTSDAIEHRVDAGGRLPRTGAAAGLPWPLDEKIRPPPKEVARTTEKGWLLERGFRGAGSDIPPAPDAGREADGARSAASSPCERGAGLCTTAGQRRPAGDGGHGAGTRAGAPTLSP